MTKRMLLVQPGEQWDKLADLCRGMGFEPIIVGDAAETASGKGILQPGQVETDTIVRAAREHRVNGIWTADDALWPMVTGAAARLGHPHQASALRGDLLLEVQAQMEARQAPFTPVRLAAPALEQGAGDAMATPMWVRASGGFMHPTCTLVEHAPDLPLVVSRARKRHPDAPVYLQQAIAGPTYRLIGFKTGRAFHPVEIISESHLEGAARVPMCWAVPAGLSGYAYNAVLDAGRAAGEVLPHGHGLVDIEIVFSEHGPTVTDVLVAPQVYPVLHQLLQQGPGMDLLADALRVAVGERPAASPTRGLGAAVCWFSAGTGVVEDVRNTREALSLGGVVRLVANAQPGDTLGHILDVASRDRVGYVITRGPTRELALESAVNACGRVEIVTRAMLD